LELQESLEGVDGDVIDDVVGQRQRGHHGQPPEGSAGQILDFIAIQMKKPIEMLSFIITV
jgi:hypothetical protein